MSDYPAALGQRPLEVREAYGALEAYASAYGREPLLLMMHAAVPETLRADLLNLIKQNFLPGHGADLSMEADVLFSPLTTDLGGGYYRIDPQVRWHCLGLLRSLYRDETRSRQRRVAELLWRYVESMEQKAVRTANPLLSEFLDVQRWVALAFLEPASAAHAFAEALHNASENPAAAIVRLGGLTSAIELPLANEQELIAYARGLDALATGDDEQARTILGKLGDQEIRVGGITLRAPAELLKQHRPWAMEEERPVEPAPIKKTCFVIMGFGHKTDYRTGRTLDLDASYRVIKAAVESAGLACLRVDEIPHSGASDQPMYERLLISDLVIADLSAYNVNAAYELGVRYALRPYATLVLAEDQFMSPFDLNHITIHRYRHGGEAIDREEADRFREELQRLIETALDQPRVDSPVYRYLPSLQPPQWQSPDTPKDLARQEFPVHKQPSTSCFVIQGFGKKTDYTDSRELDLDASYQIIKEAVEAAGLACARADEIVHSGTIDLPMYEHLLNADLVIADLSTYDINPAYELGVRHALRPYSTIVLAEEQFRNPFDSNTVVIRRYKHLGRDIGFREAQRLMAELKEAIIAIMNNPVIDSPVYTFLPQLHPPVLQKPIVARDSGINASVAGPDSGDKQEPLSSVKQMDETALEDKAQKDPRAFAPGSPMDVSLGDAPPDDEEAGRLLEELNNPALTHQQREHIGVRLAEIGDPRPGIGVDAYGLPHFEWCPVPPGRITLEGNSGAFDVEAFFISKYPVTFRQYRAFLDAADGYYDPRWWADLKHAPGPGEQNRKIGNHPAERVSWFDAVACCRWLSAKLGFEIRLPAEWEWQQAATGGNPENLYPWGKDFNTLRCNTYESGLGHTTAVGLYPEGESPVKALDMSGNVWEWCSNCYDKPGSYEVPGDDRRVVRGGSWVNGQGLARAAYRGHFSPDFRRSRLGFRVVCSSPIIRTTGH